MKKDDKILKEVIQFIPEHLLPKNKEITEELSLEKDLGIYGEDAWFFILDFSEKFKVDVDDFNLDNYFTKESRWLSSWIKRHVFKSNTTSNNKKELTIRDLVESVKKGKLV